MKASAMCVLLILWCTAAPGQQYQVLWSFGGSPTDGAKPLSNLVADGKGNLYGTTEYGGNTAYCVGCGTVFELSPNSGGGWTENVLYSFCTMENCSDGNFPMAGVTLDKAGNLYGTASSGGISLYGIAYKLSPPTSQGGPWTEGVLYNFCTINVKCPDGAEPESQLTFGPEGNLYGTTVSGGAYGEGTVFELSASNGTWSETVLYSFCANGMFCLDGAQPQAGVIFDSSGDLYGTTTRGGALHSFGNGTVYELSSGINGWTERVLEGFGLNSLLGGPIGMLTFDPSGNLYGTAFGGGPVGAGGVFQLLARQHSQRAFFFNGTDGQAPASGVIVGTRSSAIYGTTVGGGITTGGTVYKIGASGGETVLYNFCQQPDCEDGANPYSALYMDKAGNLYGTTQVGGTFDLGVAFEVTP